MSDTSLFLRLGAKDNVAVARVDAPAATTVAQGVQALAAIPAGHKVATMNIPKGAAILKHGVTIGQAAENIPRGAHVHRHNVLLDATTRQYEFCADYRPTEYVVEAERDRFMGIIRPDGRVATRNYIGVMASVNCSVSVCRFIADQFCGDALAGYPNVDGVVALGHATGCGMDRDVALKILRRTMAGYARHPNFAAVVFVGLGCEVNQIGELLSQTGLALSERLKTLIIQEIGGTRATVARGVEGIRSLLPQVNDIHREPVPASHLSVALQCGGSDGYSTFTANPALGIAADTLVRQGGTAILSETPEIFGVEHLLARRAETPHVAQKLVDLIHWWRRYTAGESNQMTNEPPPGNVHGGITTITEKSLGAAMKGGSTALKGVFDYAAPIETNGFVFMDAPGFDPVAVTGQVASGANLVCFTTGRGSVYGCKPVPSIKLATNTPMFHRMQDDMDINCGVIADGYNTIEDVGAEIYRRFLDVASGARTKSESLGIGDAEFIPWRLGAIT